MQYLTIIKNKILNKLKQKKKSKLLTDREGEKEESFDGSLLGLILVRIKIDNPFLFIYLTKKLTLLTKKLLNPIHSKNIS